MNPNAAAFAQILKQREGLNAANGGAPVYSNVPQAPPPPHHAPNYGHNPQYYPFQAPIPYAGQQQAMPQIVNNGQSFMSAISYAYPGAFPAPQMGYAPYSASAPAMYGGPPIYSSQNYPMTVPQHNFYPNTVSHTQLPVYSHGSRPSAYAQGKPKSFTQPRAPVAPTPVVDTSGQWYCEPCDKEFTQLGAFEAHKNTHEKCSHPGCPFSATRKVVQAHFHGSHGQFSGTGYKTIDVEGQKFRVLMGQSPEEIAQWRADRRKKFPTAEVEEAKKKQLAELVEAGGVAPKSTGNPGRVLGKKRDLDSAGVSKTATKQREASESGEVEESSEEVDENASADMAKECNEEGDAEAVGATGPRRCYQFGRGKCKSGDSCAYSHDFEPKVCTFFIRGFCKQGFKCHHIHDNEARKEYRANNPRTNNKADHTVKTEGVDVDGQDGEQNKNHAKEKKEKKSATPKKPPTINKNGELSIPEPLSGGARGTLWRKLLEDEITKEENIVLQCLRFLVQNDFLDGVDDV